MAGETKFSQIVAAGSIVGTDKVLGVQAGPTDVVYTISDLAVAIGTTLNAVTAAAVIAANAIVIGADGARGTKASVVSIDNTGNVTGVVGIAASGQISTSVNGALSTPGLIFTGTWIAGGTATSTKPYVLIEPVGTTSTAWAPAGTGFGINGAAATTARLIDVQVGGTPIWRITGPAGTVTQTGGLTIGATTALIWSGNGRLSSSAVGTVQFGDTDTTIAVAQTVRAQSIIAGTAATNGQNLTFVGSLPTGTGTSGDMIFQTGVKTGSGTTQGVPTTALTIKGETQTILIASGKALQLGNAATTGLTPGVLAATTNATIVISDSSGQAYRIPCII